MKLENGYKVIYEKVVGENRAFYASKSNSFVGADAICEVEIGKFKLIYEKDGQFYGSETGIPTEKDYCFAAFDKVFVEEEIKEDETVEDPENGEVVENEEPTDEPTEEPIE